MVSYNCFIALRVVLFPSVLLILRIFVVMTCLFPLLIVSSIESVMWLVILVPITCRVLSDLTSRWLRVLAKPYFPLKTREKKLSKRKQSRPISSHLDPTNLVNKRFIMLPKAFFFLREITSEQDRTILPVFVANQNTTGFALSCPSKVDTPDCQ